MLLLPILLTIISSIGARELSFLEFTRGLKIFASDIYNECVRPETKNVVISPYSVASTLALLSQATEGNSLEQIKSGLHLSGGKSDIAQNYLQYHGWLERDAGKVSFSIANQIFVQQNIPLNKNFQAVVTKNFHSGVQTVDFAKPTEAVSRINRLVAEKTHNKIKELITPDSLSPASRVVLINAIHMDAKWKHPFEARNTRTGEFYLNENEKRSVDCMHGTERFKHAVLSDLRIQVLEMEYADSDLSMLILLPDRRTGLSSLESQMRGYDLDMIVDQLKEKRVEVMIPKFKIEHKVELNDVLKRLRITDIFEAGKTNWRGLLENNEPLAISQIIHKALIEVDEEGTEAAAATGSTAETEALLNEEHGALKFVANRPFVYLIWDRKLKMPIFSGHITRLG